MFKENINRRKFMNICYSPAGRSVLGKTVPEVLSTARLKPKAGVGTQDRGHRFSRPRLMNNISIFLA